MRKPPRPQGEHVVAIKMWEGILLTGTVMAAGTRVVLDASLPGGFMEGSGTMRYAQTMAFTTLVLFSVFAVFNARSDEQSAFIGIFSNKWLLDSLLLSILLQFAVVYVPVLQHAFSTVALNSEDWLFCDLVASSAVGQALPATF